MGGTAALERLLVAAKQAHGEYERTELGGVYDEDWPRWYAAFLVEHGLAQALAREVGVDDLAQFLAETWAIQETSADGKSLPWESFTARRLQSELGGPPTDP
jgi:hypothetical protein